MFAPVPLNVSSTRHIGAEQIAEPGRALGGVVVGAVGEGVAVVAALERLEDGGMDAGGVVAGERAGRSGVAVPCRQSSRARVRPGIGPHMQG